MKNIGTTLKALRAERGYTLRQLAEKVQMPYSHLSNIENGKIIPRLDILDRICYSLGVSTRDILIKTDLEGKVQSNKQKLFKDLMPYFRKIDAVAKQIYGPDNNRDDERDDMDNSNTGFKPIIGGAGSEVNQEE